jgi:ribonuclease BN (tRNA processing enzyme)
MNGPNLDRHRVRTILKLSAACGVLLLPLTLPTQAKAENICRSVALGVQVLGSGGPFAGTNRASSSYLVWVDGRAVVMVDVGGGAFLRFGESEAELETLSLLAVSHLHPDHVADLPALLWTSDRARKQPLRVAGPSGNDRFPGFSAFLHRLFDQTSGAFQVLSGTLGGPGAGIRLDVTEVNTTRLGPARLVTDGGIRVSALPVPHANAPALAYRIEVGDRSIVFSSDQNGSSAAFTEFARAADVLVMHFALSPLAPAGQLALHAPPKVVGQVASTAAVRKLVLSHFSKPSRYVPTPDAFSLSDLAGSIREVARIYDGPIVVSKDLDCIAVP